MSKKRGNNINNSKYISGFLINSLPKSGTHLVKKVIEQFPGILSSGIFIGSECRRNGSILQRIIGKMGIRFIDRLIVQISREIKENKRLILDDKIPIGVVSQKYVCKNNIEQILDYIKNSGYATSHLLFSPSLADLLDELELKMFLVLRDPRDVVISQANYIFDEPKHDLHHIYRSMDFEERVRVSITGIEGRSTSIHDRLNGMLPWKEHHYTYPIHFERLVGVQGGGSQEEQIGELTQMADHLGVQVSQDQFQNIAKNLFGGTKTFRKGVIGGWRECLSPENSTLFKEVAGDLLIQLGYETKDDW